MATPTIQHFVSGRLRDGTGEPIEVRNPATGQVSGRIQAAGPEELAEAVTSAAAAFEGWSQQSLSKRAAVLFAFRELVAPAPTGSPQPSPPSTARPSPTRQARSPVDWRTSSSPVG